jgi:DNA-binding HxlR family transcriptional regulator
MKISLDSIERCPVTATMEIIGGKWKMIIMHLINNDIKPVWQDEHDGQEYQ